MLCLTIMNVKSNNMSFKKLLHASKKLTPDYMFETYTEISPEFLNSIGVKALFIDLDNTIASIDQHKASRQNILWFEKIISRGIKVALVSNASIKRVNNFNANLGVPIYANCKKPSTIHLLRAISDLKIAVSDAAMLGDQIFSDILCGRIIGVKTIMVCPIQDKKDVLTRFKRFLERRYILRYAQRNGYSSFMKIWKIKFP